VVSRKWPSIESVTMVVLCGPMGTSYSTPHGMGVNHFFSTAAPRVAKTCGYVAVAHSGKPVKVFVIQCPQCQPEAVDVASNARLDCAGGSSTGAACRGDHRSWATASWRCLGHHWLMRITPCTLVTPLWPCRRPCTATGEVRRTHGVEVQIRVGLNSGEGVVRAISNDLHMDYPAIGQTTHLAAHMEQLATPGSIRLMAETLLQVTPLWPVPVKGLPEPVEVYELVGASALRRRLQAAAARGLTHFVGRQLEEEVHAFAEW
jgi:hypothetical protein